MRSQSLSTPRIQVKKILPGLRRRPIDYSLVPAWHARLLLRLQTDSQFLRSVVQIAFLLLCIWIGIEFWYFVQWGSSGGSETFVARPPGSEGFLPISAIISLKYWLQTGMINDVHPAGLFIFLAIAASGFLLKKAFCSWLCPIGTLSESLWMLGKKLFGGNLFLPRWLDYPLRSLKYLLLYFFVSSIWQMDIEQLRTFIYSPYNKVAEIKMYGFFAEISSFALWTIIALMLLSIAVRNFWCRFLCPYGALLGALSWLSPVKITRDKTNCIDCTLCTKACPSGIKVHAATRVLSDECMSCYQCVEACPVKNTLEMRGPRGKTRIPSWTFALLVAGLFVAITGSATIAGHWDNGISKDEYLRRFNNLSSPLYQHHHGTVPEYGPED